MSSAINSSKALEIAESLFAIKGEIKPLPGELDANFRIKTAAETYILKISRPDADWSHLEFQQNVLEYAANNDSEISVPEMIPDRYGNFISKTIDETGHERLIRLISWIDGRLYSSVDPKSATLLYDLGQFAGRLTKALQGFDHPVGHRNLNWDIARAAWTFDYRKKFNQDQREHLQFFGDGFDRIQRSYQNLRKSIVHNDVNDHNIIVTNDLIMPKVKAIIDFGDAIYTQIINDLAITMAYAAMDKPDPLAAAVQVAKGYHRQFPLLEEELPVLYNLIAMRLVISITQSALRKETEPGNEYLVISERPAWELLEKWRLIDEHLALYHFRNACGFTPHPVENKFMNWSAGQSVSLNNMFPATDFDRFQGVDMSVSSVWLGGEPDYTDIELSKFRLDRLKRENSGALPAGGYLETRPFYSTDAFKKEGNNGPEYRTVHLGVDFWVTAGTAIHALFDGKVYSSYNNDHDKDYGPTLILEHEDENEIKFYTLYGHLSRETLSLHKPGDVIKKGNLIGYIGSEEENGHWAPHVHFQIMLDMLGNVHDFPGVAFPAEMEVWKSICPDPNLLFSSACLTRAKPPVSENLIKYRKNHLGKSLSLSYDQPLKIVRGAGAFLIDDTGRKYLDTVNNVAHVGHEHPRIVKAGQSQMAVLNTNTRYLHDQINTFAGELLSTFPDELSVVHFVNSGSEANELALRMAYACTGQKDMIAVEVGYHGNTTGCVAVSSYKFDGNGGKGAPEHTQVVPLPDAYRGLYRGDHTGPSYAAHVQEKIDLIKVKGRNIAGFICESIISCGGQIELPDQYLNIAYNTIREAGGLCIADEVQVGCGRVGNNFWGFQLHDVIPDIVTIGKPLGNGHPVAAVVCTREVADAFANGMEYFNTFGGNPVSCAIGLEVLRVIRDERLQENALNIGNYLKRELRALQRDFPVIGEVRGQGLFLGIEFCDPNGNPLPQQAAYLVNRIKELGILMSFDGRDNNVLKIKPPLVFSMGNADELLQRLRTALQEDFMRGRDSIL